MPRKIARGHDPVAVVRAPEHLSEEEAGASGATWVAPAREEEIAKGPPPASQPGGHGRDRGQTSPSGRGARGGRPWLRQSQQPPRLRGRRGRKTRLRGHGNQRSKPKAATMLPLIAAQRRPKGGQRATLHCSLSGDGTRRQPEGSISDPAPRGTTAADRWWRTPPTARGVLDAGRRRQCAPPHSSQYDSDQKAGATCSRSSRRGGGRKAAATRFARAAHGAASSAALLAARRQAEGGGAAPATGNAATAGGRWTRSPALLAARRWHVLSPYNNRETKVTTIRQ